MKSFKRLQVSIDFSTRFLIISLASEASHPDPPTYFPNFLNYSFHFRENLDYFLQMFSIDRKISFKIFKI